MASVRMIDLPNSGASTVREITVGEAVAIRNSCLMRPGNVRIEPLENGFQITDSNGTQMFTQIAEPPQ